MHRLIREVFAAAFDAPGAPPGHDAAVFAAPPGKLAFTTDSYVVQPLRFPGGDIGAMAVHGTVNDLAMAGARPHCLSAGFILEAGLSIPLLQEIVASMAAAAQAVGVRIVTGDTKVIERRDTAGSSSHSPQEKGGVRDTREAGLYINTAGIGIVGHHLDIAPHAIRMGDRILVNGDLGRHGMAVMACREGLGFDPPIESDSAPVVVPVLALLDAGIEVHCLRDLTRGGLASTMNEIAEASGHGIALREADVPVREDVRGACELLGFDPLHVANEGRFAVFVPERDATRALEILEEHAQDTRPAVIGRVTQDQPRVLLESVIGVPRILDMLSGEQLPRIC
jgi:hydrogenase expression/formation protein HypE